MTILYAPPIIITTAGNERQTIAKCTAIIKYLNDNAQTPLNRLVVYMLYSQLCNTYSEPMELIRPNISAVRAISSSPSVANCLSQLTARASAVQWIIFLSPQLPIQNGSREQNHAPFRGDLSSFWQDLIYSPFVQSLRAQASVISEIWMLHPKFKTCHVT